MTRKTFLSIVACVATTIGLVCLLGPGLLLRSKGVEAHDGTLVWVRETGIALVALGVISYLVRDHQDSATMRAFLIGNVVLQLGLFPVEILAYLEGTITKASGVIPNSILHVALAASFAYFAIKIRVPDRFGVGERCTAK